mgnify:FL=1
MDLWQQSETRHEVQSNLIEEFPHIDVNRKLMMDTVRKLRRKGFELKDIPPDETRINYKELKLYAEFLKFKNMNQEEREQFLKERNS